jgi:hypothetical protein
VEVRIEFCLDQVVVFDDVLGTVEVIPVDDERARALIEAAQEWDE